MPYYGYGDAVVRLSLGDSTEIGGAVRGGEVRWFFFPDATVTVGGTPIVLKGIWSPNRAAGTGSRADLAESSVPPWPASTGSFSNHRLSRPS